MRRRWHFILIDRLKWSHRIPSYPTNVEWSGTSGERSYRSSPIIWRRQESLDQGSNIWGFEVRVSKNDSKIYGETLDTVWPFQINSPPTSLFCHTSTETWLDRNFCIGCTCSKHQDLCLSCWASQNVSCTAPSGSQSPAGGPLDHLSSTMWRWWKTFGHRCMWMVSQFFGGPTFILRNYDVKMRQIDLGCFCCWSWNTSKNGHII